VEVDGEINPGAPSASQASLAKVSPHKTRMKMTNTDYEMAVAIGASRLL
jgi:hypothetical protein